MDKDIEELVESTCEYLKIVAKMNGVDYVYNDVIDSDDFKERLRKKVEKQIKEQK